MKIQDLTNLVQSAREKDFPTFERRFESLMQEKIENQMEAKRLELATSFFVGGRQK